MKSSYFFDPTKSFLKKVGRFCQILVAFLEYINFIIIQKLCINKMKKNENNKTPSEIVLHHFTHFDVHCTETSVLSIAAAYILQLEYFTNHWGIHL